MSNTQRMFPLKRMRMSKIDVQYHLLRWRFYRQLQPAGVAGDVYVESLYQALYPEVLWTFKFAINAQRLHNFQNRC